MPATRYALGIEISNPSSGPRGPWKSSDAAEPILVGPGVALAPILPDGSLGPADTELLSETGRHDDDLMPAIDRLFRRHNAAPADLARIAISIGPGGYTSLRIAVATAKMLAQAAGAAIFPIPSATAAAYLVAPPSGRTLVCLASKGDTAHATLLADGPGRSRAPEPLGLIAADALAAIRPGALIADRFLPDSIRAAAVEVGAALIEPVFAASSVLILCSHADPVDPLALAPLYPRQAEAVTQWRLRHPAGPR